MIKANVRKLALLLIGMLATLLVFLGYWQVVAREQLVNNPYNRRLQLYDQVSKRGNVKDYQGRVLAYSVKQGDKWQRVFPLKEALAPVTGYNSFKMGKTGIEAAFDSYLIGLTGGQEFSNKLRVLGGQQPLGLDLVLTLDSQLQELGCRLLQGQKGAIVVLEPTTGKVRALVAAPSFDPNRLDQIWGQLLADQANTPLLNRATLGLYPPGSTMKVATGATALEQLPHLTSDKFACSGSIKIGGYQLTDQRVHGLVNFNQAMAVSCNTTFASLALQTGSAKWLQGASQLGLDQKIPFVLPTTAGRLPTLKAQDQALLAQAAIGQGPVLETPLHMALLAAGVANQGKIMQPQLMERIETADGQVVQNSSAQVWLTGLQAQTTEYLKTAMIAVINQGTGKAAGITGTQVAGKTGSAENPHGNSHAWFIGFAPAEKPQLAIAVIVENGGAGGAVAAPIAKTMLVQALSETR